jgi:hypothetical protein
VIFYIFSQPNPITSVTANSGAIIFTQAVLDSTNDDIAIWYAKITTGTTADITVTSSGGPTFGSFAWSATITGSTQTAPSSTGDFPSASPPGSIAITVPTGGVAGAIFGNDGSGGGTLTNATSDTTGANQNLGHNTTAGSQTIGYTATAVHVQGVAFAWGP